MRLLAESPHATLARAALDPEVRRGMERLISGLDAALARPCAPAPPADGGAPVAVVCAEYGVHASLPVYAGGLGVLAGDMLAAGPDDHRRQGASEGRRRQRGSSRSSWP